VPGVGWSSARIPGSTVSDGSWFVGKRRRKTTLRLFISPARG